MSVDCKPDFKEKTVYFMVAIHKKLKSLIGHKQSQKTSSRGNSPNSNKFEIFSNFVTQIQYLYTQ